MNKKGITLIEIIISIVLISIVLIFLFSLLITVNDINKESEVNSTYLINKSLILKNIEKDLKSNNNVSVTTNCDIEYIYSEYTENVINNSGLDEHLKASKCVIFNIVSDPDPAYLGVYYYDKKSSYVISYIHGDTKATRTIPDFEKVSKNLEMEWKYNGSLFSGEQMFDGGFHLITIPIIGPDGKDYSINISYYNNN